MTEKQKCIVIPTFAQDVHAYVVAEALERIGMRHWLWHSSEINSEQNVTIEFGTPEQLLVSQQGETFSLSLDDVLCLWNRRIREINAPSHLEEEDSKLALANAVKYRDNILSLLNAAGRAVNDVHLAKRAENKALQLHYARRAGLLIPETAMSNDRGYVSDLIAHNKNGTIAKSFAAGSWAEDGTLLLNFSALVKQGDLPAEPIMRADPMIFQGYVDKQYEVRITWFGTHPVAVKLVHQSLRETQVDWRADAADIKPEIIDIPEDIRLKCLSLMKEMGLAFSCMDFIVTNSKEWVFLEMNQMGQFLWIEKADPTINMLDLFLQLLIIGEVRSAQKPYFNIALEEVLNQALEKVRLDVT